MYTGTRINEINDGKIYAKNIDGECIKVGVVGGGSTEIEPMEDLGINKEYGVTLNIANTCKVWKKKRKGKRWVWYYEIKPRLPYKFKKLKFGYSKKKPRGKKAKEWRKIVKFNLNFMKNFRVDYTQYDNLYPSCVTPIKPDDETKFKAVVTKRVDELKGEE